MNNVRVRFAPSPTGSPHIGNIRTAIYDWLLARHVGGTFILRIEDTDRNRYVPGSLDEILESLRWLGLTWDEGPEVGGEYGPYLQSERLDLYAKYAQQLLDEGKAYRCFCTSERLTELRKDQESRKQATGYDRLCLSLTPEEVNQRDGMPYVLRFKVPETGQTRFEDIVRGEIAFENNLLDDFIVIKSDGYPTYQFANVVDDHLMEITHVIRGDEWISSTPKHLLEYQAFGWVPPKFAHASSILGPDRSRLAKRHGSVAFLEYREKGLLPEALLNFVALLGWSPGEDLEVIPPDELIARFTLEGLVKNPAVFDIQKLEWMNGVYIRQAPLDRIANLCLPYLQEAGLVSKSPSPEELEYVRKVVTLEHERLKVLSEIVELTRFFFEDEPEYEEKGVKKWLDQPNVPVLLRNLSCRLQEITEWTHDNIEEAVRQVGEELGLSGGQVIHPIRMAVTGRTVGPGLFESMAVLGEGRVLQRLQRTLALISEVQVD
jgi:glutamyl-tRNA synthetase